MSKNNIKNYFPFPTMMNGQETTIEKLQEAYDSDYKYFLLDAPVGSGKSGIARALCNYLAKTQELNSYILTPTIQLQEQYEEETKHEMVNYHVGKGRSNYPCNYRNMNFMDKDITAEYGACVFKEFDDKKPPVCPKMIKNECDYYIDKNKTKKADVAIMNYNLLLHDLTYEPRYNMVCDEAHNIESKLMQIIGFKMNEKQFREYGESIEDYYTIKDIDKWVVFFEELILKIKEKITYVNDKIETLKISLQINYNRVESRELNQCKKELKRIEKFRDKIKKGVKFIKESRVKWFVIPDDYNKVIGFKPLKVSEFSGILFNKSNFHLLMSGTIIDKENYCDSLGINLDDVYYYKQPSTFNLRRNNPLIIDYVGSMNYKSRDNTLPSMYVKINEILEKHKNDKGIIHCVSKTLTNKVKQNIKSYRLLSYDSNKKGDKEEKLKKYEDDTGNSVLLGYSLGEGLNLPDDHIRFQIFMKAPYMFLGDPVVKARKSVEPDWFMIESIKQVVQMQGRGMRNKEDYCCNYVLDTGFAGIFNHSLFPDEVKESIKWR